MKTIAISAAPRAEYGKKATKAVRREGLIPCVIYGGGETVSFSIDEKAVKPLIYTPNSYIVELDIEGKNRVIAEHPEFAHVICRCETVTEGEILEAIRTNPKPRDLDGVKRRTRATMGRCQGGFCTPYIIELLASEMGCEYDEVTKFGGDSRINIGRTK